MVEFVYEDFNFKAIVNFRYQDLISVLPIRVTTLAWTMLRKHSTTTLNQMEDGFLGSHPLPIPLSYKEDALQAMSLPKAYVDFILNLPQVLQILHRKEASFLTIQLAINQPSIA
ncbi:hypothetical protein RYX36_006745 [Vicia faba]